MRRVAVTKPKGKIMKVKTVMSQCRNDFTAVMECEHCGETELNRYGYNDLNYYNNVIPSMHCDSCKKNRAGELECL